MKCGALCPKHKEGPAALVRTFSIRVLILMSSSASFYCIAASFREHLVCLL